MEPDLDAFSTSVVLHERTWSGNIVNAVYDYDNTPNLFQPSLGRVVDHFLASQGFIHTIPLDIYQQYTNAHVTATGWSGFRTAMMDNGMSEHVAWFIYSHAVVLNVPSYYSRADFSPPV